MLFYFLNIFATNFLKKYIKQKSQTTNDNTSIHEFKTKHIILMKNELENEFKNKHIENTNRCMLLDSHFTLNMSIKEDYEKVLAIEFSETYLKLALMDFSCEFIYYEKKYKIIQNKETRETDLFDWIVQNIKDYLHEANIDNQGKIINAAMSFSYPIKMESVSTDKIGSFKKELPFKELDLNKKEGIDPKKILNDRLSHQKIKVVVKIIMNNTVATFLASYRKDQMCKIGIVLGLKTNAAFVDDQKIIINMEWGQFRFKDSKLKKDFFLNQNIDGVCGEISLKNELRVLYKNEDLDMLIYKYYDGSLSTLIFEKIQKLKNKNFVVLSILTVVLLGKEKEYVIGIHGSGLEEDKDQFMFKDNIIKTYKIIYKNEVKVRFVHVDSAVLVGLAYGFFLNKLH